MSVEILIGRAGTGKTFACLQRMRQILETAPLQTEIIYLLPAYQTYRAELELVRITGGSVSTRMESFQRFARQILSEVGGAVVPRISDVGRRLLLRKILISRSKDLLYYRRAARQRGFAETLAQELQNLRTYSIDAEKLAAVTDKIDSDDLKSKLHDLALLYDDFRNAIADKQNDESDLLERAAELIKDSAVVRRAEIFIDGFIFFDPQQRKVLREVFKYARNVYVTLPLDTNLDSRENTRDIGIFNRAYRTLEILRELAGEIKITRFDAPKRFESAALQFLEQNFFALVPRKFEGAADGLKLIEAVNKRVEVEAAARDIIALHERGFRFRDIGIIARDENYGDLIKAIFEIHGIPFFVDDKRAAAHHPLAELIRSALEILRGWRAEAVFRCLRTDFFNINQEDIDLLENYVLEFGLRGEKIWTSEADWHWYRHKLDDTKITAAETERLAAVDKIRRAAVAPLAKFAAAVKRRNTVRNLTTALYELIDGLNVHEKLEAWAAREEAASNLALSKEHLKIWDDVMTLFEQVVDTLDEDLISAREFESIINEGLDALEMSLIPPALDEITVSKFDQNSLQNSKAIYVLGFSNSSFPKSAPEKNLLSDADRLRLNEAGIEIAKGGSDVMLAEKFLVYRGLTEARNYLYVSYPLANAEGDAMYPAANVERLKFMFDVKVETVNLDVLENLGSEIDYRLGKRELSPESAKKLYAPNKNLRGSVTNLETFNKCPFSYFAQYGLKLEQRREYKVTPPDIGNILHSVMCQFGERLKAENRRWASVNDAELEIIVAEILDELTPNLNNKILLSTGAYQHQRERIKSAAITALKHLIKFDAAGKFRPILFEETFGAANSKALIYNIAGVKMELAGKIDRVDFSEDSNHFLIIDYKTGSAYLNLTEIFTGVNLQLLTYLMVVNNLAAVNRRAPAAMMYYFLKYPVKIVDDEQSAEAEVNKALKLSGWTLDDVKIIKEIDGTANLDFLKVQLKGNGALHSRSKDYVKSEEQFALLMNFVEEILQKTGAKILQGDIKVKPFKSRKVDACKYCAYGELCGVKPDSIKPADFGELDDNKIFEKMENHETGLDL